MAAVRVSVLLALFGREQESRTTLGMVSSSLLAKDVEGFVPYQGEQETGSLSKGEFDL